MHYVELNFRISHGTPCRVCCFAWTTWAPSCSKYGGYPFKRCCLVQSFTIAYRQNLLVSFEQFWYHSTGDLQLRISEVWHSWLESSDIFSWWFWPGQGQLLIEFCDLESCSWVRKRAFRSANRPRPEVIMLPGTELDSMFITLSMFMLRGTSLRRQHQTLQSNRLPRWRYQGFCCPSRRISFWLSHSNSLHLIGCW